MVCVGGKGRGEGEEGGGWSGFVSMCGRGGGELRK